jgi:dihydroorotase
MLTITHSWLTSKCGWTPFDGVSVTGWPVHTMVNGKWAVRDGQLVGAPHGQVARFLP